MTLIDLLPPEQPQRPCGACATASPNASQYMRRVRKERKLLCVGVDLPIDAGTCGRFVHAGYQRCIHCTRRRWWLLKHALNAAEVAVTALLEEHADDSDALYGVPQPVPLLEDVADPCLAGEVPNKRRPAMFGHRHQSSAIAAGSPMYASITPAGNLTLAKSRSVSLLILRACRHLPVVRTAARQSLPTADPPAATAHRNCVAPPEARTAACRKGGNDTWFARCQSDCCCGAGSQACLRRPTRWPAVADAKSLRKARMGLFRVLG